MVGVIGGCNSSEENKWDRCILVAAVFFRPDRERGTQYIKLARSHAKVESNGSAFECYF